MVGPSYSDNPELPPEEGGTLPPPSPPATLPGGFTTSSEFSISAIFTLEIRHKNPVLMPVYSSAFYRK
jgi:hypothetical protein